MLTTKLTNIANAIRNKTKTSVTMTLDEMPSKIESIETASKPNLQDKEVTPTKQTQVVNYDENYDGLNQVTVKPIPSEYIIPNLQNKSIEITDNGTQTISADAGYDGLNEVEVITNVASSGGEEKINPTSISFLNSTATTLGGFEHLDTSNIRDMNRLFYNCKKLTSLDLKRLDVSNVTNMNEMFSSCSVLTSVDVTGWNTNNVTTMYEMFRNCMELKTLDLSSFVGTRVTNTSYMFSWCTKLTHLDMRNFDFTNVTTYGYMFDNVPSSCEIIVKDDTAKAWILARRSNFTNVKTVAEL